MRHDIPLIPKSPDGQLTALAIGRLSKPKLTDDETEMNLNSSIAAVTEYLANIYEGPLELIELAEQASGLISDRATILEAMELIQSGVVDVVVAEDLGRIFRNPRFQYIFVQDAVDAGARVICFGDNLDTADENWELMMSAAALRHGMTIPETRRRVKRTATYAFHSGGNVQKIKFGYRKLTREEANSGRSGPVGLRIAKLSECTAVIKMMRRILMLEKSYSAVLNWIEENMIPPGPYVRSGRWTERVIKDLLSDPLLIGLRRFRVVLFRRILATGKFHREMNPKGPETEHYPELAHLTDDEFVTLQETIEEIAERYKKKRGSEHALYRRRRKDSIFPRQHATCAVCRGLMHAYDRDQMKCEHARGRGESQCWNHVQVNCEIARERVINWLFQEFEQVAGFRQALVDFAWQENQRLQNIHQQDKSGVGVRIDSLERQAKRLAKAIAAGVELDSVMEESRGIKHKLEKLYGQQRKESRKTIASVSCESREEIDAQLKAVVLHLAKTSHAFADLMRSILPRFEIVPIQGIDSGQVYPRARITFNPRRFLERNSSDSCSDLNVEIHKELDLFEPPKHYECLQAALELKSANPKLGCVLIARTLSTDTRFVHRLVVRRALRAAAQMAVEGLSEPYRVLLEEPESAARWRRQA